MKKTLTIPIFMLFIFISFVSADLTTLNINYYKLDSNTDPEPDTITGLDLNVTGASFTSSGFINGGYNFTSGGDILKGESLSTFNSTWTIGCWVNMNSLTAGSDSIYYGQNSGATQAIQVGVDTGNRLAFYQGVSGGSYWDTPLISTDTIGTGSWEHVIFSRNGSNKHLMITNGTYDTGTTTENPTSLFHGFGNNADSAITAMDGLIDECSVWSRTLSEQEMRDVYAAGIDGLQYPYAAPANISVNESTEGVVINRQVGSVTFAGGGFNTISDINFNITQNDTSYYFGHTIEATASSSGGSRTLECQVLINGTVLKTITRTMTPGSIANVYIVTDNQTNSTGLYNEVLQCQRGSGSGQITVSKSICVGHILLDQQNKTINHAFRTNSSVSADTGVTEFNSFSFTTNNVTLDSDHTLDLILDYNIEFDHTNHNNISVWAGIQGQGNCTPIQREATSGTGVGGNVCIIKNVSVATNYNVKSYVQGDAASSLALSEYNLFVKEFVQDDDERETVSLAGVNITSTLAQAAEINITNLDHTSVDIFTFAGISLSASSGYSEHQINILNGDTQTGFIYNRTMNGYGALGLQEVLSGAAQDQYFIEYNASSSQTSTYAGGDLTAYFANIVPVILNSFEVQAFDYYDNNSINNFSIVLETGSTFSTTTGSVQVFASDLVNFTITSNSSGGYFSRTILNHNSSNDINLSLNQTIIKLQFVFDSGDLLNFTTINITDNITSQTFSTTNGIININPPASSRSYLITDGDNIFPDFNEIQTFTALQNQTINISINEYFNVLTFLDANDSSPIDNATITITYPSGKEQNVTTNSTGQINFSYDYDGSLEFGNYDFFINKLGFVNLSVSETINETNIPFIKTYNISRATLIINIYNRDGGIRFNGTTANVDFVGVFNETTTVGLVTKDNLSIVSDEYIIYVSSEGFKTEARAFTFTNQEILTLDFYLLNLSDPNLGTITVSTTDSFFRIITDAQVELLEYDPGTLSFISVSQCITNINGECSFNVELNTKTYYLRGTSIIGGEVFIAETSSNGEIFTQNDVRNLIFFTRSEFTVSESNNLIYDIDETFVNNISSISLDYSTIDGTVIEVCIEYFRKDDGSFVSVTGNTYCVNATSAIQNVDASVTLNRSNEYRADVYIKQTNNNILLQRFNYPSITSISEVFDNNFISAFVMIFWILALAFCLHSKNMVLWFIMAIILSWVELLLFPQFIIVAISVYKTLISIITLLIARKKQDLT